MNYAMGDKRHVFIVGAGFSKAVFPTALLTDEILNTLKNFLN